MDKLNTTSLPSEAQRLEWLKILNRYKWPILVIVIFAYIMISFSRGAPAIMGPALLKDLHLTASQWGLVGLVFFWAYAFVNAPAGAIMDKFGPRICVITSLLLIAVGCFFFSIAEGLGMVLLGRGLVAVGSGALMMSGIKLISSWFTVKEFPFYYGLYVGIGGLGSFFATGPLNFLMNSFGWRMSFVYIAVGTVIVMVITYFIVKNQPADVGIPTPNEIKNEPVPVVESNQPAEKVAWSAAAKALIQQPVIWLIVLFNIGTNSTGQVIGSMWGGVLLANVYGFDKGVISTILTVSSFGRVFGSVIAGSVARKIGTGGVLILAGVLYIVTWLYMLLNLQSLSVFQLEVIYTLLGFSEMFAIVGIISTVRTLSPVALVGTAVGLVNTCGWVLGGGVFNQLWGLILDSAANGKGGYAVSGFVNCMWLQTVALSVTFICGIILYRKLKQAQTGALKA